MDQFGIRDAFDIAIVALLLFYLYRIMKESGTINIFFGVLAFIVVWVLTSQILNLKLIGTILDQFMGIGLLVLVILFQDQIKRFLVELGDHKRWRFLKNLFRHEKSGSESDTRKYVLPIVYACMNMSKTKTGALIVKNAAGYQILYSTNKSFKKNVKKITSKSVTCTVKKLKHGKKYYFKARAYAKSSSGKTIYGAYSSIKGRKF